MKYMIKLVKYSQAKGNVKSTTKNACSWVNQALKDESILITPKQAEDRRGPPNGKVCCALIATKSYTCSRIPAPESDTEVPMAAGAHQPAEYYSTCTPHVRCTPRSEADALSTSVPRPDVAKP